MNKKAWIKILEAFFAIMLILGVALILLDGTSATTSELDTEIHESELIALRDIQMNSTLRQKVLDATPPLESDDSEFPSEVADRINYFLLSYLECTEKICEIDDSCSLDNPPSEDVYALSIIITSTKTTYDPKQLKIFCWVE